MLSIVFLFGTGRQTYLACTAPLALKVLQHGANPRIVLLQLIYPNFRGLLHPFPEFRNDLLRFRMVYFGYWMLAG